jgi:hypothetical protein
MAHLFNIVAISICLTTIGAILFAKLMLDTAGSKKEPMHKFRGSIGNFALIDVQ